MGTAPGCPPLSAPPTTSMRLEALPHGRPTARKYSASRRIRRAPRAAYAALSRGASDGAAMVPPPQRGGRTGRKKRARGGRERAGVGEDVN